MREPLPQYTQLKKPTSLASLSAPSVQKAEREQKRGEHPNAKLQASEHLCCRGLGELVLTDVTFCEITGTLIHAQIYKYKH